MGSSLQSSSGGNGAGFARTRFALLALLAAATACSSPSRTDEAAPSRARSAEETWSGSRDTASAQDFGPVASQAARLQADVDWLADDAREGRRAGTRGERDAADFIAQRFEKLGLEPAGVDGYFQELGVQLPARDGGNSSLRWVRPGNAGAEDRGPATGPEKLVPLFCSAGETTAGKLFFRGYGIEAPGMEWHDYGDDSTEKLRGAIVLVVRGAPPLEIEAESDGGLVGAAVGAVVHQIVNPHDPHAQDTGIASRSAGWGISTSIFSKVMEAKRRGAAGVLLAQHPDDAGKPLLPFDAGSTAQANIPAVMISAELAEELLPGYAELMARIDADEERHARPDPATLPSVHLVADVVREKGTAVNVLARLPGRGNARTVIVGAHYDHLGHGGEGSLAPDAIGQIHNGADDNASGTAVVLELAREMAAGPPPPGDVVFALWSAEELGLLGSEHWSKHPTIPLDEVGANLNLDMVGRVRNGKLHVLGAGSSATFREWLGEAGKRAGLDLEVSYSGRGLGGSDHQTFLKREIPALHLFSGVHPDYHRPSDDADRFEAEGAVKVCRLASDLVARMQRSPDLSFQAPEVEEESPERRGAGWSVSFGSIPDYAYDGNGLRLSGVSPGTPAERAGLMMDDVIVRIDDIAIENIYDFVHVLQIHKPGDVVLVRYLRGGEPAEVRLTLASRALE